MVILYIDLSSSTEFFITGFEGHVPDEPYDVATVVGMLEHVPITRHPEFFAWLADRMNVDGRVYLQCIIRNPARTAGDRTRFLNQFVFTHELSTLDEIRRMASKAGFEVVEVEEGHEDYAFTTRHWVERIRAHETEIRRLLDDDRVYRILLVKQS
ncbi:MAG: class I SAM-dependent methyltransferase [Candidatus Magasanikbacteria bacterium]